MGDFFAIVWGLILVLIVFAFLSWLAYLVLYFPTKWLVKSDKLRVVRLVLSPLTVILASVIFFSTRPSSGNDDTATIESIGSDYQVTLKGQRHYMVHDPISLLMSETYTDSFKINIPRTEGVVNGQNIPIPMMQSYKFLGTVKIDKEKVIVDLYYDNYTDNTKDPISWNGEYKLKWKGDN